MRPEMSLWRLHEGFGGEHVARARINRRTPRRVIRRARPERKGYPVREVWAGVCGVFEVRGARDGVWAEEARVIVCRSSGRDRPRAVVPGKFRPYRVCVYPLSYTFVYNSLVVGRFFLFFFFLYFRVIFRPFLPPIPRPACTYAFHSNARRTIDIY